MHNPAHKSLIGIVREHVISWRKQQGWSLEAVVQEIVEAHERIDGPSASGIVFDPPTRDTFQRQHVNAQRVFRWLDDESKANNLLPVNFLPSILAALPMERRLHLLNDFLRPLGVSVTSIDQVADDSFDTALHLRAMLKESSEAHLALVNVPAEQPVDALEAARREVADVQESSTKAVRALDAAIAKARAMGGRLKSAVGMR
jgi:hypothetical protein